MYYTRRNFSDRRIAFGSPRSNQKILFKSILWLETFSAIGLNFKSNSGHWIVHFISLTQSKMLSAVGSSLGWNLGRRSALNYSYSKLKIFSAIGLDDGSSVDLPIMQNLSSFQSTMNSNHSIWFGMNLDRRIT